MKRRSLLLAAPGLVTAPGLVLAAEANKPVKTYSSPNPEFTLEFPAGQKMTLSQFRGKCVALEIFKTTCPHCQESMPLVQRLYREYAPKGFQALAVAVDQYPASVVAEFAKRYQITFPIGWAPFETLCKFLEVEPQNLYVPSIVTFARNGKAHARHLGGDAFFNMQEANLRNEIEYLLSSASTPAKAAASRKKA